MPEQKDQVYLYDVLVSRSYRVYVKAKSKRQADEAFYAGEIQTSDIHERCVAQNIEVDLTEFVCKTSDGVADFDVTGYVMNEELGDEDDEQDS